MFWQLARWFDPGWWSYLFWNLRYDLPGMSIEWEFGNFYVYRQLPWPKLFGEESVLERVFCRAKGHPKGEVFFNVYGDEPDHRCRTCGEDLG